MPMINHRKKSLVRVKIWTIMGVSSVIAAVSIFRDFSDWEYKIIFASLAIMGIYIHLIRCEDCKTRAFRAFDSFFGIDKPTYFDQPKRCPKCGIERI